MFLYISKGQNSFICPQSSIVFTPKYCPVNFSCIKLGGIEQGCWCVVDWFKMDPIVFYCAEVYFNIQRDVIWTNIRVCDVLLRTINNDRRHSMEIEDFLSVLIGPKIDMLCSRRLKETIYLLLLGYFTVHFSLSCD